MFTGHAIELTAAIDRGEAVNLRAERVVRNW